MATSKEHQESAPHQEVKTDRQKPEADRKPGVPETTQNFREPDWAK